MINVKKTEIASFECREGYVSLNVVEFEEPDETELWVFTPGGKPRKVVISDIGRWESYERSWNGDKDAE